MNTTFQLTILKPFAMAARDSYHFLTHDKAIQTYRFGLVMMQFAGWFTAWAAASTIKFGKQTRRYYEDEWSRDVVRLTNWLEAKLDRFLRHNPQPTNTTPLTVASDAAADDQDKTITDMTETAPEAANSADEGKSEDSNDVGQPEAHLNAAFQLWSRSNDVRLVESYIDNEYWIEENTNYPKGKGNLFLVTTSQEGSISPIQYIGGVDRAHGSQNHWDASINVPDDEDTDSESKIIFTGDRSRTIEALWNHRQHAYRG